MADKKKEIKITVVSFTEFEDMDFKAPSTFFIKNALNEYLFIHTSTRSVAQEWSDENYGAGHYKVIAAREQKTKSRMEGGGLSCHGTATRARAGSKQPK